MPCYWKFLFPLSAGGGGRSLLADWDFLPCVTVSVIAMSHFKDFMWVDGWSTTRERTVVKIPINEGQRNMTWAAPDPYQPMAEPVDWNCIPSDLGRGSVLSVRAGRLHFPLAGSWHLPLSVHSGVHPILTLRWWTYDCRDKMNSSSFEICCHITMQSTGADYSLGFAEEQPDHTCEPWGMSHPNSSNLTHSWERRLPHWAVTQSLMSGFPFATYWKTNLRY